MKKITYAMVAIAVLTMNSAFAGTCSLSPGTSTVDVTISKDGNISAAVKDITQSPNLWPKSSNWQECKQVGVKNTGKFPAFIFWSFDKTEISYTSISPTVLAPVYSIRGDKPFRGKVDQYSDTKSVSYLKKDDRPKREACVWYYKYANGASEGNGDPKSAPNVKYIERAIFPIMSAATVNHIGHQDDFCAIYAAKGLLDRLKDEPTKFASVVSIFNRTHSHMNPLEKELTVDEATDLINSYDGVTGGVKVAKNQSSAVAVSGFFKTNPNY